MSAFTVPLPHGVWRDAVRVPAVVMRPVDGTDEVYILEQSASLLPAALANGLLGRCLVIPDAEKLVGDLSLGDREALLLSLRRASFGDRIDTTLDCPRDGCRQRLDLELTISDFLLTPYANPAERYEVSLPLGTQHLAVTLHPPRAADQEAVLALARRDPDTATEALLARCVEGIRTGTKGVRLAELPPDAVEQLIETLAVLDPQAELRLDVRCAACGELFAALLDAAAFLLADIESRAARLLRDVHVLARHYHWSERDILALPAGRRERYLGLLAEAAAAGA
jgi:hypothetical protein